LPAFEQRCHFVVLSRDLSSIKIVVLVLDGGDCCGDCLKYDRLKMHRCDAQVAVQLLRSV
jgi:hypothetical protein